MSMSPFRYAFTIFALVCLTGFAVVSDSCLRPLADDWRQSLGFAPISLVELQFYRVLTCLFLTAGAGSFFSSLAMLGFAVGMVESMVGTAQTIKLFLSAHIVVLLMLSILIVLPACHIGVDAGRVLAGTYDVGPSAGYYGCLGGVIALRFKQKQSILLAVGIVVLAARLSFSAAQFADNPSVVSADIAHLIALPLGWLATHWGFINCNGIDLD